MILPIPHDLAIHVECLTCLYWCAAMVLMDFKNPFSFYSLVILYLQFYNLFNFRTGLACLFVYVYFPHIHSIIANLAK